MTRQVRQHPDGRWTVQGYSARDTLKIWASIQHHQAQPHGSAVTAVDPMEVESVKRKTLRAVALLLVLGVVTATALAFLATAVS